MTRMGFSLLIIDDDAIQLATMASTVRLKFPQAEVERMNSAVASLERIRSRTFEAILCDGQQPGMEGTAFVRAVRRLHPETPVVLLVEKDDEDATRQAMEAGAYEVLVRPVGAYRLAWALQRAIETRRLRVRVQREQEELLTTLGRLLKDLEGLYGADGLSAHFAAFMDHVNQHKQNSGTGRSFSAQEFSDEK